MDVTEQARRSDALYYSGNDGINRRWLCDKVASLEAENAKLRELVDYMAPIAWYAASERERDRMRELEVEVNA